MIDKIQQRRQHIRERRGASSFVSQREVVPEILSILSVVNPVRRFPSRLRQFLSRQDSHD